MIETAIAAMLICAPLAEVSDVLHDAGYEFHMVESPPVRGAKTRLHYARPNGTAQPAMALVVEDGEDWCVRSVGGHDAWAYQDGQRRKAARER